MEKAAELEKKTINPEFDYCRDRIVCQDSRRDRQVVAYSLPERRENRRSRDTAEKPGTLPVFFLRKMREVSRLFRSLIFPEMRNKSLQLAGAEDGNQEPDPEDRREKEAEEAEGGHPEYPGAHVRLDDEG